MYNMMNAIVFLFCLGMAGFQFGAGNPWLGLLNIGLALINLPFALTYWSN